MLEHLTEFFARTHLVVLHFPIALLIVAAAVELLRALNLKRTATHYTPGAAGTTMFAFALVACTYTVLSGLVLGFNDTEKVDLHRILGIITAVLVLLTAGALLAARKPAPRNEMGNATSKAPKAYLALLCLSALAVGLTGHFGGELTHGQGYITRPLTQIFEPQTPPPPPAIATLNPADLGISQAALDTYLDTIQPIFDQSCIECHGPDKAENDVRLDALEYVLDPALDIIDRTNPSASELLYLIELPAGDPDIMPPEDDADPLNPDQIEAIRTWIESLAG
jgi:mono/diheme cytochrome c family protein/uncharacterized membrane protein